MARLTYTKTAKRTTIFKRQNKVANCPICGKFYNSRKDKKS